MTKELKIIGKCRSCGNEEEESLDVLGGNIKDNFVEIDIKCDKCGTVMRSHYDCTSYSTVGLEEPEVKKEDETDTKSEEKTI